MSYTRIVLIIILLGVNVSCGQKQSASQEQGAVPDIQVPPSPDINASYNFIPQYIITSPDTLPSIDAYLLRRHWHEKDSARRSVTLINI